MAATLVPVGWSDLGMHSFTDDNGKRWTACCECNRGGNGNDKDKCSCGWQSIEWDKRGCFLGSAIVGEPVKRKKMTRSQKRYKRYNEYGDCFDSFRDFLAWDCDPERSWNGGCA